MLIREDECISHVLESCGRRHIGAQWQAVSGGNINDAYRIDLPDGEQLFLKLNAAEHAGMFESEVEGLTALGEAQALKVPWPIGQGVCEDKAWLLCEYLPLGPSDPRSDQCLGEGLAALHEKTGEYHGWNRDNHIGLTPQANTPSNDWTQFFAEQRLRPQGRMLAQQGGYESIVAQLEQLIGQLPTLLEGHAPQPSLLHGDLWFGNYAALPDGTPVVFDPACHHGDADCDLAMTELFGGFGKAFYDAYRHHRPEKPGYPQRRDLYQLYHALNHLNLFGNAYMAQCQQLIARSLRH